MRRVFFDDSDNMAAESGCDSRVRGRRRRDTEDPEKSEFSERELALGVAEENVEENEERWVGPLPVEATLAKKRKGSCRVRTIANWNAEPAKLEV